jgi:hypothetical protein
MSLFHELDSKKHYTVLTGILSLMFVVKDEWLKHGVIGRFIVPDGRCNQA